MGTPIIQYNIQYQTSITPFYRVVQSIYRNLET